MSLFNYKDYGTYLKKYIQDQNKVIKGETTRMAEAVKVHPSLLSQVLAGSRDLSNEQTILLAKYLGFTELETEYFYNLVQLRKAGNPELRQFLSEKLKKIQEQSQNFAERFEHERVLTDSERAQFYSSWLYSAIRLFCSTSEKGRTLSEIESKFHLEKARIRGILEFLVRSDLITEHKEHFKMGAQRTYLPKESPFIFQHHKNWRIKAMHSLEKIDEGEQIFSCPMSISKSDFQKLKALLAELIQESSEIIKNSPAEDIACLNIDLFWIKS